MTPRKPGLYSIPPGESFLDALAEGVLASLWRDDDPLALTEATILVPTRRAARALGDAFLRRATSDALLLPAIRPIGDVDEDELAFDPTAPVADTLPAIAPLRRQLLLARLILRYNAATGLGAADAASAAALGGELATFIDEAESEGADLEKLATLAPEAFAEHWTKIVTFLDIVRRQWPTLLALENAIDPAARRNAMLRALAASWRTRPPAGPVIVAGSTGSLPATAELMATILTLKQGFVVLPGLDMRLDNESWDGLNAGHPQFGLKLLLDRLGRTRTSVAAWSTAAPDTKATAREALLSEAMRPPSGAEAWHASIAGERAMLIDGLAGLELIEAPGPREEAAAIAVRLREALADPDATAALVTPDRTLARRVAAELQRWAIDVDDTGGTPLAKTDHGAFLALVADAASPRREAVGLLALLKHPLTALGRERLDCVTVARELELKVLRGGPTRADAAALRRAIVDRAEDLPERSRFSDFADAIDRALTPLSAFASGTHDLAALARAHTLAAEAVAADGRRSGADILWRGEAGSVAFSLLSELIGEGANTLELTLDDYARLFASLARARPVRPRFGKHPRVFIWGPLEARLLSADVVVLGGLNENVWPQEAASDPWLSRPMRATLGLTEPERRIGLSAHDFVMLAAGPTVVLSRAAKSDGQPADPSRFLLRLMTLIEGLKAPDFRKAHRALAWSAGLVHADVQPAKAPQPRPPVAARPRRLSATQIETWIRDPYAVYARHILRLRKLDPIGLELSAAQRGNLIHNALEKFVLAWPDALPEAAERALIEIGEAVFAPFMGDSDVKGFWWPRFLRVVDWFVELERERRVDIKTIHAEIWGDTRFDAPGGMFELLAKADRIEELRGGGLVIVDYKTGQVPKKAEMAKFSPQLPLEAIIAEAGGFKGIAAQATHAVEHIKLSGGRKTGEVSRLDDGIAELLAGVRRGLIHWIAQFDDPATPYLSRRAPKYMRHAGDYDQLARVAEWAAAGGRDE